MQRIYRLAPLLLILAGAMVALGAYLQVVNARFIADDNIYITDNLKLAGLHLASLWRLFVEPYNDFSEFLPLRDFSYWLDISLFGFAPAAFRIHNMVLYVLCLPLVFLVTQGLWRYFRPADGASAPWAAAVVTALFAVHPSHVEAVVWISGRKDVLSGFFSLLALWLALGARREQGLSPLYASATLVALGAAMLSKASSVAVVLVIVALWITFWRDIPVSARRRSQLLWPLTAIVLAVVIALVFAATISTRIPFYFGIETFSRSLAILGWMARLALSPEAHYFYYPVFEDAWFPYMVALGAAMIAAAVAGLLLMLRKRSLEGFALIAFPLLSLPYLQWVPYVIPSLVSDRFLFLAVWPIQILIVALAWKLMPLARIVLLTILVLPWLYQTVERPKDWRSPKTFVSTELRGHPGYYLPIMNHIWDDLIPRGLYSEALEMANRITLPEFRNITVKLIEVDQAEMSDVRPDGNAYAAMLRLWELGLELKHAPDQSKWNPPLFNAWEKSRIILAAKWGRLAERFPDDAAIRYKQGLWLIDVGRPEYGIPILQAAVKSQQLPENLRGPAYFRLGQALLESGDITGAEQALRAALEQRQADSRAHCLLAKVSRQVNQLEAATHAEAACNSRTPNIQDAVNAYEEGDYPAAIETFRRLADEGNSRAQYLLGLMYDNGQGMPKDYTQAVVWYRKASAQGDADAQYNLGMMYANGLGAAKDLVQAYKWFSLSAMSGNELGLNAVKQLQANMTPEQISEAKVQSRKFQAEKNKKAL